MASRAVPASKYPPKSDTTSDATNRRGYWEEQIQKANKRWDGFETDGDAVVNRFMLESGFSGDKYNILYSSTETIKPSLYGQTPKVQVKNRQQDTEDNIKVAAAMLLEQVAQYAVDMLDFDYVMQCTVSDYVLPGIGVVWVRYDPKFTKTYDNDNKPVKNEDGSDQETLSFEGLGLDYVFFKDFRCGLARDWHEVPWISRKVYMTKPKATKRFGKEKADKLDYSFNSKDKKQGKDQSAQKQAIIYEIWDKENAEVVWFSEDYPDDVIEVRSDPLRLENFYPCPRPLRAVWTSRSFIPKALYSQYKAQAAELDRLTERIRYLTEALKVRGVYDGSQANLANVLDGPGNKMIPIQDWTGFIGSGGMEGAIQWVPIKDVVNCLTQLFQQREICKNEIYEITGFSDIVRGVSKASETLGAQEIKSDWATGRLKDMQREVQRFCRDIIRLFVEIAAEHFSKETLMVYSGITVPPPSPEEIQAHQQYRQAQAQFSQAMQQYQMVAAQAQQQGQPPPPPPDPPKDPGPTQGQQIQMMFDKVVALIRKDKLRCASIGIETDSTILPDEQKEREDRMQFLSSMGAFLQQAAPLAMQYPDMRGLLGGIMMFTLRTFSASRPLEKEFEIFQQKLAAQPPMPPPGQNDGQAAAQSAQQVATIKAQTDQQIAGQSDQTKRYEIDTRARGEQAKIGQDHEYRMAQLALENNKLNLERQKLGLDTLSQERAHTVEAQRTAVEAIKGVHSTVVQQQNAEDQRQHDAQQAELDRQHEGDLASLKQEYDAENIGSQQAHEVEMANKTKKEGE